MLIGYNYTDCVEEECTKNFSLTELNANSDTQTSYSSPKPTDFPTTPDGLIVSDSSTPPDCSDCLKLSDCLTPPQCHTVPTCPAPTETASVTPTVVNDCQNCIDPCPSVPITTPCSTSTTEIVIIVTTTTLATTILWSLCPTTTLISESSKISTLRDNTIIDSVLSTTVTDFTQSPPTFNCSTVLEYLPLSERSTVSYSIVSTEPALTVGLVIVLTMLLVIVTAGWALTCWTVKKQGRPSMQNK